MLLAAADIHLVVQRQQAADLVMPSKLPNIMAAGRPFIATTTTDTELGRVTVESQAGLLTRPEDAGSLSQAIQRLATDSGLRERLSVQGRQYAEAHWHRRQLLGQWETLLNSLSGELSVQ